MVHGKVAVISVVATWEAVVVFLSIVMILLSIGLLAVRVTKPALVRLRFKFDIMWVDSSVGIRSDDEDRKVHRRLLNVFGYGIVFPGNALFSSEFSTFEKYFLIWMWFSRNFVFFLGYQSEGKYYPSLRNRNHLSLFTHKYASVEISQFLLYH